MKPAFTLIELLVVITIIVVLLALLAPALDKAITAALKAKCLANQHNIVQAAQFYATDSKRIFPPFTMNGSDSSAYDLRGSWSTPTGAVVKPPMGLGLLPAGGYLPTTQLGKIIHCPCMDNSDSAFANLGMDRIWHYLGSTVPPAIDSVGGSWWVDPAYTTWRVIGSFNYRAASYYNAKKGNLKQNSLDPLQILTVDSPDLRFAGKYTHPDGYNRVFVDGHGAFFFDPDRKTDNLILTYVTTSGTVDGLGGGPNEETWLYPYLATDKP